MSHEIQKLYDVWNNNSISADPTTQPSPISFKDLSNAVTNAGPFYLYVVDFETMAISDVHPEIENILGFDPQTVSFMDIVNSIHPDDIEFVANAERSATEFICLRIPKSKLLRYKSSYCFRMRKKDGTYSLFNHQAMMLFPGINGGFGKALNIHTQIDHLSTENTYLYSVIGLDGEKSFMNLKIDADIKKAASFSCKELAVIKHIANGLDSNNIAEKMFISPHTVKKHRANILRKSGFKNVAELIKNAVIQRIV